MKYSDSKHCVHKNTATLSMEMSTLFPQKYSDSKYGDACVHPTVSHFTSPLDCMR